MGSVIVRVAEVGEFFATRDSARRLIKERADCFPERETIIFDWCGVAAVSGAFASEFAAWCLRTGRRVGNRGMNDEVRETYETAWRRLDAARE